MTRHRPMLRWARCAAVLLGFFVAAPAVAQEPAMGDVQLGELRALGFDKAFKAVAEGVRYEPYAGVLRGPRGTALSGGGNSADQATLLADLLRAQGYQVRFVRGRLEGANLDALIRGMYPPDLPQMSWPQEFAPYDPLADQALRDLAADHVWVEAAQSDGSWLPLDPAFPRARIGEAYAAAAERFDAIPDAMRQRVVAILREETAAGAVRELGRVERDVAGIGFKPLSLAIVGAERLPAKAEDGGAGAAGLFGSALDGAEPTTTGDGAPGASVGVLYRRQIDVDGEATAWADTLVLDAEPKTRIVREWLEIQLHVPGRAPLIAERDLFVVDAPGATDGRPPLYRRYAVAVIPGPLKPDDVRAQAAALRGRVGAPDIEARLAALSQTQEAQAADAVAEIGAIDGSVAPLAGHLLALAVAAESDAISERVAYNNAVAIAHAIPRVVIVSVEGDDDPAGYEIAVDLRIDDVEAWPFPGHGARAAFLFQEGRGMQNSILEGRVLEAVLGRADAANTMNLMARVDGGAAALLSFAPGQADQLAQLSDLPPYARRLIERSLAQGRSVVLPPGPIELAGRARYGWWEVDPATGRIVGVMDDGLHQAMIEHGVDTEEIGLNDFTGKTLGMLVGATTTHMLLANGILEYGDITKDMIKAMEEQIKQIKCFSCPQAERKLWLKPQLGDSCLYFDKAAIGFTASHTNFCRHYFDGFSCSATAILDGLKGKDTWWKPNAPVVDDKKAICEY